MKEWKTLTFFRSQVLKRGRLGQFPDLREGLLFRMVNTQNHIMDTLYVLKQNTIVTNTLKYVFIFKLISNQLNILVGCNLTFTKSLNASYFEMDG